MKNLEGFFFLFLAASGAIDEDTFIRSFEDVPKIFVSTGKHCQLLSFEYVYDQKVTMKYA